MSALLLIIVAIAATMMGARSERFRRARSDMAKNKASIGTLRKTAMSEVGKTVLWVAIAIVVLIIAVH